uniref:Cation efflux protein transmembrane domain-containing protein n=1 Tax=Oncorhynchus tshawytscha TaxID=74940 RepID=A0AAZ3S6T5_ONCTS
MTSLSYSPTIKEEVCWTEKEDAVRVKEEEKEVTVKEEGDAFRVKVEEEVTVKEEEQEEDGVVGVKEENREMTVTSKKEEEEETGYLGSVSQSGLKASYGSTDEVSLKMRLGKSAQINTTLTAFTYLTIFDLFSLITCLLSSWVAMKKPSQLFSFGFERLEVLAVFSSTVLVQLGALFILKESLERFVEQPEVHTGRLLVGTFVALFFNLLTLLSVKNKPFVYVSEAASTSWLQEHVADLSRSLCGIIPGLSSVLLPRMNPFVLINVAGALSLCITYMLIEINNYNAVDTVSAVAIGLMIFGTMYPMSVYSGKVLLQTTPSHVIGQLDKLLREVSTLDGVLEVRNEHFWTVGFGSLAGSVHVRIRRDANEQMVLAHVTNRLFPLVSTLTVQIFKDDWIRPSLMAGVLPAGTLSPSDHGGLSSFVPPPPKSSEDMDRLTSTPSKLSSPPPEFSFNTPGRHVQPMVLPSTQHQRPYSMGLNYGASPYTNMLNQNLARPGSELGMGMNLGMGVGMPSSQQGFRTALGAAPQRFGINPLPSQYSQYRP